MQQSPPTMAHRSDYPNAVYGAAVAVLAACAIRHYGYTLAPDADRAHWWNVIGALMMMAAPAYAAWHWPGRLVWAAAAWWLLEEAMVVGCSLAYIVRPWAVADGQDQCSALLGFDLGKISAVVMACILVAIFAARRKNL